jgi:hypothetical protein
MVGRPSLSYRSLAPHRSTGSCYCSPTSVTTVTSYYGLIEVEVEVEFNGSDVGVSTACQRRKIDWSVGGWVDESVAGSRGVRLAQVVYEERNRSSGRQHRIRITITFAIAVRRAHKQSETQPSQQDSHARTSRGQAGPLLFNDAIDVSTQSRVRDHRTAALHRPPSIALQAAPRKEARERGVASVGLGPCF